MTLVAELVTVGRMKLSDFIDAQGLTASQFGVRIGVSRGAALRYATGARIPHPEIMARIYVVTGGAVTPNDFYDLPEPSNPKDAAA